MDKRLKEVHQTDLTEGRLNQDFVEWLQTKGMSWLLVILVALCAYFLFVRWKHHKINHQTEAWQELSTASLPTSFEDVAEKYADVGAVADLARLRAADLLLNAVQTGKAIGAATDAEKELTDQDREDYLIRADRQYAKVLEGDDGSNSKALIVVTALSGRAAVAESKGEIAQAKSYYDRAAQRAENAYPNLAEQARLRSESVSQFSTPVTLLSDSQLAAITSQRKPQTAEDVSIDPWAFDLIMPKDES